MILLNAIVIENRSSDVIAYLKDYPEYWECAFTYEEAIGNLIRRIDPDARLKKIFIELISNINSIN